jgi:predicted transcriptional regulator
MMTTYSTFPAHELRAMGQRLIEMADTADASAPDDQHDHKRKAEARVPSELSPKRLLSIARHIYRSRRGRAEFFNAELFADPAWDILLDLFIAELCGKHVSTTRLCLAAAVPATTAHRYVAHLESVGLVTRANCETDGRVQLRSMTPKGFRLMRNYLEKYWTGGPVSTPELLLLET